jgi:hypothetical protein
MELLASVSFSAVVHFDIWWKILSVLQLIALLNVDEIVGINTFLVKTYFRTKQDRHKFRGRSTLVALQMEHSHISTSYSVLGNYSLLLAKGQIN